MNKNSEKNNDTFVVPTFKIDFTFSDFSLIGFENLHLSWIIFGRKLTQNGHSVHTESASTNTTLLTPLHTAPLR